MKRAVWKTEGQSGSVQYPVVSNTYMMALQLWRREQHKRHSECGLEVLLLKRIFGK
jgi:hypothetical protein